MRWVRWGGREGRLRGDKCTKAAPRRRRTREGVEGGATETGLLAEWLPKPQAAVLDAGAAALRHLGALLCTEVASSGNLFHTLP